MHWRLLTTHTVTTLEQARQIVAWYRLGGLWAGVPFDEIGLFADRGFANGGCQLLYQTAVVGLIAAIRSMQLVMARDGSTSQPITDAADPADMPALRALNTSLEGRTEKLRKSA